MLLQPEQVFDWELSSRYGSQLASWAQCRSLSEWCCASVSLSATVCSCIYASEFVCLYMCVCVMARISKIERMWIKFSALLRRSVKAACRCCLTAFCTQTNAFSICCAHAHTFSQCLNLHLIGEAFLEIEPFHFGACVRMRDCFWCDRGTLFRMPVHSFLVWVTICFVYLQLKTWMWFSCCPEFVDLFANY